MELILETHCSSGICAELQAASQGALTAELICEIPAVSVPTDDIEHYTGAYDVTPLITAQVLATRDKLMDDNVRVDMIPTREENNAAGGVTFIVGG